MRLALLLSTCLAIGVATAQHGSHSHTIVMPNDLKWQDVASLPPGAKVAVIEGRMDRAGPITARLKLPANYRIAPHRHPGLERVTVLTGTVNIGMGEKFDAGATTAMAPGTVLLMSAGMPHFVWTKDETIFQLNVEGPWGVTYVNPADDPRKKPPH
ncbi:MAG TPA: cupin domain-containing protein [Burkholderiales bacterium]|nr:cupin domain-containing protein [Burkholderiales bacterium]